MLGLLTLGSLLVALVIAAVLGPLLGRLATQWFSGRGVSNLLTELRGAFLPFLVAPMLSGLTQWSSWLVVGVVVGLTQAISVGRWAARRTGEWSPSLVGGIALGRSRAALLSAQAMARGAIVGTIASTAVHVILLEAILAALGHDGLSQKGTIGGSLESGAGASSLFLVALGGGCVFISEVGASFLFQNRRGRGGAQRNQENRDQQNSLQEPS